MVDAITIATIILYCIALIGIGSWASRKIHNTTDYIVAGRSLGFWVFTILVVASICSGMTLLGVSGLGFKLGWPTIWEQIFVPLAAAFLIIVFGVKLNYIGKAENPHRPRRQALHRLYLAESHAFRRRRMAAIGKGFAHSRRNILDKVGFEISQGVFAPF